MENNNETPIDSNVLLTDSSISLIKKDIEQLKETLEMIEWGLNHKSNNIKLWVADVIPQAEKLVRHFS